MAKKKQPLSRTNPIVSAILLVDAVSVDPNSKKATLYGLYDKIYAGEAGRGTVKVFTRMFGGKGKHKVGIEVVTKRGKVVTSTPVTDVEFEENKYSVGLHVFEAKFPRSDTYRIHATIDGKRTDPPCILVVETQGNKNVEAQKSTA